MFRKLYKLIGSPVNGIYMKWYKYLIPRKITMPRNPTIYCWLGFNFHWIKKDNGLDKDYGV